jgi:hypothetical protein
MRREPTDFGFRDSGILPPTNVPRRRCFVLSIHRCDGRTRSGGRAASRPRPRALFARRLEGDPAVIENTERAPALAGDHQIDVSTPAQLSPWQLVVGSLARREVAAAALQELHELSEAAACSIETDPCQLPVNHGVRAGEISHPARSD